MYLRIVRRDSRGREAGWSRGCAGVGGVRGLGSVHERASGAAEKRALGREGVRALDALVSLPASLCPRLFASDTV